MKKALLLILLATTSLLASAQLKVTSDGKVKISSTQTTSYANLLVGNSTWGTGSSTVGISGSPATIGTSNNIGIVGTINANSSYSNDNNYSNHERNSSNNNESEEKKTNRSATMRNREGLEV